MNGTEDAASRAAELWQALPVGYVLTVLLEMPILLVGLSPRHSWGRKIFAGFWLTACTYPIVVLVLPLLLEQRFGTAVYLTVAETFAPLAECTLFWLASYSLPAHPQPPLTRRDFWRDMTAIVVANLTSFLIGGLLWQIIFPSAQT